MGPPPPLHMVVQTLGLCGTGQPSHPPQRSALPLCVAWANSTLPIVIPFSVKSNIVIILCFSKSALS